MLSDVENIVKFERIIKKMDPQSELLRVWELKGGVSAVVSALEVGYPDGAKQKLVVRQHSAAAVEYNPNSAADEYKLLRILEAVGLAAPRARFVDQSREILPTPYVVMTFVAGEPVHDPADLSNFIQQSATYLACIHTAAWSGYDLSFLLNQQRISNNKIASRPELLDESLAEGRIRDFLQAHWPPTARNKPTLVHGDFWPGNLLWVADHINAVVDWEDVTLSDPLFDLATSRLEFLWAFGQDAMRGFTALYQSLSPLDYTDLPYWDLYVALKPAFKIGFWAGDPVTEAKMRAGHHWFIEQAFEQLAAR